MSLVLPEYLVSIKIEKLEEGVYLATSDNLQGLVAQGRTIAETMEIAQDVARKLIESIVNNQTYYTNHLLQESVLSNT